MTRLSVAVPAGLIAGAFVGLMIGGLWLQWQLGANMNAGHPFICLLYTSDAADERIV